MACRFKVGAVLVALALMGCKGSQPAAASTAGGGSAMAAAGADDGIGTRLEYITDPTLNNMRVMPIQIPASWTFRGVLVPKTPCTDISEVFRATSPDGHSFAEVMPRVGWSWGNLYAGNPPSGCLPFDKPVSALEFVKHMTAVMQVEFLQEEPVRGYSGPVPIPGGTWTTAMATVRYKNGSLNMKGLLQAGLFCRQAAAAGRAGGPNSGMGYSPQQNARPASSGGHCDAVVSYWTAPESQFDQVIKIWSAPGMGRHKELDEWVAAYSQRYANQLQAWTNRVIGESNEAFAARQQMYKDAAVVQQQAHNQFLQTMQEGTDRSMENAARIANSNHTMASDMVDYSLDRQTVVDLNTGRTGKISNQVTPGGSLQKVHGDGTPF